MVTMPFTGFPQATLKFFKELKRNNKREWYHRHKERYEREVIEPSKKLAAATNKLRAVHQLKLKNLEKNPLFRLHRDVRFSLDKSPLKTHNGMVFSLSGSRKENGVLYFHLEPGNCFLAVGFWQPDPNLLNRMRLWVLKNPKRAKQLVSALHKAKLELSTEDALKRSPKGFEHIEDESLKKLLRLKSWIVSEELQDKDIESPRLLKKFDAFAKRAAPLLKAFWPLYLEWKLESELKNDERALARGDDF
jgi:uncharacterized protein (TIGR02453 family)